MKNSFPCNSKRGHLGTFGDVHDGARAYNESAGAQPGAVTATATQSSSKTDADGASMGYSRCA
jgi:hypothetical protein